MTPNVLPAHQQAIQAKCVHPTGTFIESQQEEIEQSIPDRFEHIVRQYPDRIAVKTKHYALTYKELNHAANRVAQAIVEQRGKEPEPIALLFEHGAPMLAAILGVLKAGKCYVPLDPSYPQARLAYMVEDAQTHLLLTNSQNCSFAKKLIQNSCQLLNIEELDSRSSPENPDLPLSPDTLAYIIYTSGSTGQPKGVLQNHRNVLHKIMTSTNAYHACAEDRRTVLYSPGSSGSVWDIFTALLTGGSLYPFALQAEGVAKLATWLLEEEITIYASVPTLFRQFVSTLTGAEQFPKLRLLNLGGEAISKRDVALYITHFSQACLLFITLAATETGTFCQYFIDKETPVTGPFVPIGYPVKDKEVLLLDETGQEVGFNQVGEIVVKSRYLSPGYWRRLELTQTTFLPDPAGGDERIYHTGDLGLLQPDGCLLHVGRQDFQVKVHGYRVEIAEIEKALLDLNTIKEAVVVVREDQPGDQRLVAYLVPVAPPLPTVSGLRRILAEALPRHMIPATFVMLDALPLNPNGKVDRQALPALSRTRPALDSAFVPPCTPVEEELAAVWAEVLGIDQVGVHDHFLELGGNSLLATQVISRIITTFQVILPLHTLFASPTIADMAILITQNQTRVGQEEIAHLLTELEALSDEETQRLLTDEKITNTRGDRYDESPQFSD